jgi:hypothetical protein
MNEQYEVDIRVASPTPARRDSRSLLSGLKPTPAALAAVALAAPKAPIIDGHGGPEIGHATGWSVADGSLVARARVSTELKPGTAVSLEGVADATYVGTDGRTRLSALSVDAIAVLPPGTPGLFPTAQVLRCRRVGGGGQSAQPGERTTEHSLSEMTDLERKRWKQATGTEPGFSRIPAESFGIE